MPTTVNRKLSTPGTGTEVGVWGANDLNPNFAILDAISSAVTTLNLAGSGPVTLTDAQQQVAVIRLTGILTGNVQVTVTEPAFWIVDNRTTGAFVVTITGGAGQVIATPQGSRYEVCFDGTDVMFVNMGETGTFKRFCVSSIPAWITACTINPYLACRGGTFLGATYPWLAIMLSTQFGGNGVTTFGLPDLQGRTEFDLDNGAGRLTNATMTPDGNTLGATGGAQNKVIANANLPASIPITDLGHTHTLNVNNSAGGAISPANAFLGLSASGTPYSGGTDGSQSQPSRTSTTGISVNPGGANTALTTMPPAMVAGITFVKT